MTDAKQITYAPTAPIHWLSYGQSGLVQLGLDELAKRAAIGAYKATGEGFSGTTLQNDNELFIELAERTKYVILHRAIVTELAAGTDIKNAFAYSGTATSGWMSQFVFNFSTATWTTGALVQLNTSQTHVLNGSDAIITVGTIDTTTTGTLQWQWAQGNLQVTELEVGVGSFLLAIPII